MTTIGSLCSGYGGLDVAVPGTVAWVCDPEPAAVTVLAAHHPDAPNLLDLTTMEWTKYPVDVLTAGYPCQPFSQAGSRKGAGDERHLWPWIRDGIALMRPPTVFLENVRGHLSLGFDQVLLDLHALGYDVRWTLLRAADVGAAHGRARLFVLAADRDVHTWTAPSGQPVAVVDGQRWVEPDHGLFGAHTYTEGPPGAGQLVGGVMWGESALLGSVLYDLLPTPAVNDMGRAYTPAEWDEWCDKQRAAHGNGHGPTLADEVEHLLPTPKTTDSKGHSPADMQRNEAGLRAIGDLLPTPRATDGTKGGPNQAGSSGDLMLPSAVMPHNLLPTPCTTDAKGARNSTASRTPGSTANIGDTLSDLIYDGRLSDSPSLLLPTPKTQGRASRRALVEHQQWSAPQLDQALELLAGDLPREYESWNEVRPQHQTHDGSRWGRYTPAVARCEALTRPAPDPTEPTGRGGAQRLSPRFVEWLMMLPDGWVTTHDLTRNQQLKMLGNGVVPAQAAAAWAHLASGLRAVRRAA